MGLEKPVDGAEMAAKVRKLRLDRAWSQEELATVSGLDIVTSPDHLWFQWPALGWGIAVALQGLRAYRP